jgi:hypothetical protein
MSWDDIFPASWMPNLMNYFDLTDDYLQKADGEEKEAEEEQQITAVMMKVEPMENIEQEYGKEIVEENEENEENEETEETDCCGNVRINNTNNNPKTTFSSIPLLGKNPVNVSSSSSNDHNNRINQASNNKSRSPIASNPLPVGLPLSITSSLPQTSSETTVSSSLSSSPFSQPALPLDSCFTFIQLQLISQLRKNR